MAQRKQLQNMQLPESGYNPIVFQGYTTEGPQYDTNILANSIGRLDTAIKEAHEGLSAIDLALAEQGSKLNEKEGAWFKQFKDNFKNQIQAEIDAGNYGNAINLGKELGAQAVSDKGLNARIQYNQDLEKFKESIHNREDLSTAKKRWAVHKYGQYGYQDTYEDGSVVGGSQFDKNIEISSSWNPDQEWLIVDKMVPEESGGGGGTKHSDDLSRSTTSSSIFHRKDPESLRNAMETRYGESQELRAKLAEELQAELYNRQYLLYEYYRLKDSNPEEAAIYKARYDEETKKLTPPGGTSPVTEPQDYYKLKVIQSAYPDIFSYNNVTSTSSETINGNSQQTDDGGGILSWWRRLNGKTYKSGAVSYAPAAAASSQDVAKKAAGVMPVGEAQ